MRPPFLTEPPFDHDGCILTTEHENGRWPIMKCIGWLTTLFTLTLVACGSGGGSSPSSTPTQPTTSPARAPLTISVECGTFHPGQYAGLACTAEISNLNPQAYSFDVRADLSIFGGPADAGFVKCIRCRGGPPWTYELDVRIPANMNPGAKRFAVWATDSDGHRADTTASMEIVGPPSQLSLSTKCFGPVHPGQDLPTACIVSVEDVNYPQERRFDVWADLRIFGQPAEVQAFEACPACSGPPWAYVIKLHVPASITPGVKTFAVWAGPLYAGPNTHGADTTASIEIVP